MQKLEILLEENAFGSVRPVEVVADAPVADLLPALVEELHLPQTDLFGKKLVYTLRQAVDGHVIPEYATLAASGVRSGAKLALDSNASDGAVATLAQPSARPLADPEVYSSMTISDESGWLQAADASAVLPDPGEKRKATRRAFLITVGATLGVVGAGAVGYAAYQRLPKKGSPSITTNIAAQPTQAAKKPTPTKATALVPTTAKATLTFTQHQQMVRTVAWSSNGTMLASGADDAHVFLWGMDGAVQHDISHPAAVSALAWSPDGQRLVTGANTQVAFFNAATGNTLARSTHRQLQMVTSVAWSAKGQMQAVSAGVDMRAVVWNGTNYAATTIYTKHTAAIEAATWASDGQTVATSSLGGFVRVWNATNGVDVHGYFEDAALPMRAAAFSPNGMQLAIGGDDGIVRLWNGLNCGNVGARCMDQPQRIQASQKPIRTVSWSPDGRWLAVGADDGKFSLWAPGQQQPQLFTIQQNAPVLSIAWSPDSKRLVTASGNTATIWTLM